MGKISFNNIFYIKYNIPNIIFSTCTQSETIIEIFYILNRFFLYCFGHVCYTCCTSQCRQATFRDMDRLVGQEL